MSTRSNKNEDARRDFDGFDVDEELRRFREALREGQWAIAAELATNLDEHLSRGGDLPVAWLGPPCMQSRATRERREARTLDRATRLTASQHEDLTRGYVSVAPSR